jgi:hypothetical protein
MVAMMQLAGALPRLDTARKFLKLRKRPSLSDCLEVLEQKKRRIQAAVVLNALDPAKFRRAAAGEVEDKQCVYSDDPIIDACLRAIDALAPLDLEMMETRCEDGMPDELYPACCGYPMGWDEWEEMSGDDLDTCRDELGLYIFTTAMRLGDSAVLLRASDHFGWELSGEDPANIQDPNFERLFEMLEERGLGVFKNAINVCLYDTGNHYFDYNPWDEEVIADLPAFTLEGVRALEWAWAEAQPMREDLTRAVIWFARDMSLAGTLYDLYVESAAETETRPQTLGELWAGEADDGEPVIDEFYGPIGLEA